MSFQAYEYGVVISTPIWCCG